MNAGGIRKEVKSITVRDFLARHGETLGLVSQDSEVGYDRLIEEPAVNRPGLALAGFFSYFAKKRIQIFGNSELSYLEQQSPADRLNCFTALCEHEFPCLMVARGHTIEPALRQVAHQHNIAIFYCARQTMSLLNAVTLKLEEDFAPRTTLHGCMVDYRGIGILIMGKSGVGKSETAIGLLEKGAALVADDVARVSQVAGFLNVTSKDFARGFLEMRGVGIINVANLYGLSAIRPEKRLDLVVKLQPANDLNKVDRLGMSRKTMTILDCDIPLVEIPVAPGRDTARLIGVAALDLQLRRLGYDMADEFNQKLLAQLNPTVS